MKCLQSSEQPAGRASVYGPEVAVPTIPVADPGGVTR
jgi:hypothetical protein